jgi:pilus assembly protein CpaC
MRATTLRTLSLGCAISVFAAAGVISGAAFAAADSGTPIILAQNQIAAPPPMQVPPTTPSGGGDPTIVGTGTTPQPGQPGMPPAEIPKPIHGTLTFETGNGKMLTLTLPAANIYVADPKVAEVRPASATSLFLFGVGAGHTTVAAVDALGRLLAEYDVNVRPSAFGAREAQEAISRLIPGSRIKVNPQSKGLMLTGTVASPADAAQAMTIARGFTSGDGSRIDNQMTITAPSQVTLMVRIAEMKRSISRSLGINWAGAASIGSLGKKEFGLPIVSAVLNNSGCAGAGGAAATTLPVGFHGPCFFGILDALAADGLAHILAEPNLTVMSGQPASFQAGGEYPYAVSGACGGVSCISIEFKPYGVLVGFVPTVMGDGRINLHVKPEVSQLDSVNTAALPGGGVVNGLLVRRAETTVELGSGESFAIAGMLQTTSSNNDSGLPGLGDTPLIGGLFKNNSMAREQTELVIIVTPLLVRPTRDPNQLHLPGEGYEVAGDRDRLLLMHQVPNRDGSTGAPPRPVSEAGFMVR